MITTIRTYFADKNSWMKWVFVMVVILAMVMPGIIRQGTSGGQWILTVNGQEISYNQFVRALTAKEEDLRQRSSKKAAATTSAQLYQEVFDVLTYQELLDQAAEKAHIFVSPTYLEQRMTDPRFVLSLMAETGILSAYRWQDGLSTHALKKALFEKGLTLEEFDAMASKTLAREMIQYYAIVASYVPAFERDALHDHLFSSKTIVVIKLPLAAFIARHEKEGKTAQQIQEFFTKHLTDYRVPEQRSGELFTFDPQAFVADPTEQQVHDYYEKNKDAFFIDTPAKVRIRRIHLKGLDEATRKKATTLKKELDERPDTFAEKARELSDDQASADKGGLLEAFTKGTHERAFDQAAFLLNQDGAISSVVQTSDGFDVLQRVERIEKTYKSLKTVTSEIKEKLKNELFESVFDKGIKSIIRAKDREQLAHFVAEHKAHHTILTDRERTNAKNDHKLFSLPKDGMVAYTDQGAGYVMVLTQIKPAYTPSVKDIEARVTKELIREDALDELTEVMQALKDISSEEALLEQAKIQGATVQVLEKVKPSDLSRLATYRAQGLPIDKIILLEKVGARITATTDSYGVVALLRELAPLGDEEVGDKKAALSVQLRQERMGATLLSFIASLRRTATIKQNDSLLNLSKQ